MEQLIKKINSGQELTVIEQLKMLASKEALRLLATYIKNRKLSPIVQADMLLMPNSTELLRIYSEKYPLHPRAENELVNHSDVYTLAEIYIGKGHKFWDTAEIKFFKLPYIKKLAKTYIEQNKNCLSDAALDLIEERRLY